MRKKGKGRDVEDAELDPLHARFGRIGADLESQLRQVDVGRDMEAEREDGKCTSSTGATKSDSAPQTEKIPAPDSLPLSARLPAPRTSLEKHPHLESSSDKVCAPSQAPRADGAQYDGLTGGQLHDQRSQ